MLFRGEDADCRRANICQNDELLLTIATAPMRFLVIHAHPLNDSFGAALHRQVVEALIAAGHEIDDCDLHAEGFEPVMTPTERRDYHEPGLNTATVLHHVERLKRSEGLVFVFPTWWYGPPAILKGYIDRVWLPGVAFSLVGGRTRPRLRHIVRYAVVTTYGSPWWINKFIVRDPNRHAFMHGIRLLVAPRAKVRWLALYGLDAIGDDKRRRFLDRVGSKLRNF